MQIKTNKNRTTRALEADRDRAREQITARSRCSAGDYVGARMSTVMAEHYEEKVAELRVPEGKPIVRGGEVVPENPNDNRSWTVRNTLATPDAAAVDASFDRTSLLLKDSFDISGLAIDAAQSIEAANSLEKMLAHQLALLHKITFETADRGLRLMQKVGNDYVSIEKQRMASQEGTRLLNVAARMMSTFQQGMTTIQRIRSSDQQTMTVQHVHVSDGGQAVIGNIQAADGVSAVSRSEK